jgi:hypothetical protein
MGTGHTSKARPGCRKFSYSHRVSWTPKTKVLGGSELSWFQEKCKMNVRIALGKKRSDQIRMSLNTRD